MTAGVDATAPRREPSARRVAMARAFYRFSQSALSLVGLALVAGVLIVAVFGAALAPYPEHVAGAIDTAQRFRPPSLAYRSEPTNWGRTCFR